KGLCPFHNEKTPSFTVTDEKGFFHCHGCGAHGDVIEFLRRDGRSTFREAVEQLAAEAGLEIPQATPEEREQSARRAGLGEVLETACAWYERQLRGEGGAAGLAYLHGRGLTDETIARFRLGWSPPGGAVLMRSLMSAAVSEAVLVEAGLLRRSEDGAVSDMFRGRVMFPIFDGGKMVVGFGARALGDAKPKYLNSPDGPLFRKGSLLYGLSHARAAIASTGTVAVVEGYMDVIAMHQAGLDFAVAPLGTAITEGQIRQLWRLAPEPVLCLDGDAAGSRAMIRAADRALPMLETGKSLRFAVMPDKSDPDSLIRRGGASAMGGVLGRTLSLADVVWGMARGDRHPDTPERLAAAERALYAKVSIIPDGFTRHAMLDEFRRRLRRLYRPRPPSLLMGRSKRRMAPLPGDRRLAAEWQDARTAADTPAGRAWLERNGIDWDLLAARTGGVGFVRARLAKGKYPAGEAWENAPAPSLWEPMEGGVKLVVIPDWESGAADAAPADLIAWNVQTGDLYSRTGSVAVLGEALVAEALGFEAQGLSHPVKVADGPLSWLRRRAAGEDCVLVVDWRRAWDVLGGLRSLVAESVELGEMLDKRVRPPVLPRPAVLVAEDPS
ncbi:MAG: DNA primase, partial [Magnetospirillum sp.]|nr:DNA primase [Magnetospirillum sp.]